MESVKTPSLEGLEEAKNKFKQDYNKNPSDELVKIISEVGEDNSDLDYGHEKIAIQHNDTTIETNL
jgi:hypothetical protein